jgi:hypothetical protein
MFFSFTRRKINDLKSDKNNLIRSEFNSPFFFSSSPSIKKLATTEATTEAVHVFETVPNLRKVVVQLISFQKVLQVQYPARQLINPEYDCSIPGNTAVG